VSFEHAIDRTCEFVSTATQRFAVVMLCLSRGQLLLSGLVPSQEPRGRFRKSPVEVRVPNLVPRSAHAVAPGVCRTRDESTIRRAILHPWEAIELVHFIEQDETQDVANARHGLSSVKGLGIVVLSRVEDNAFEVAEPRIIIGDQIEVDLKGLVDSRVVKPLGAAFTLGLISDCLADCWQVIWRIGIVDMRQAFRAFAPQVGAASKHITGRAPLGRIDRGFWKHAAAEQGGQLVRVDVVICGLTAVHGFQRARVSQNKGAICLSAEIGEPIPGEETLDSHNQPLTIRGNGFAKGCRSGFHMAGHKDFSLVAQDADIHGAGMQVDTTVTWVLVGVESPEVSSS
jgi:hypothetical protein